MKKMHLEESKVRLFYYFFLFPLTRQRLYFSSPAQESHLNPIDSFVFLHLFAQLYGFMYLPEQFFKYHKCCRNTVARLRELLCLEKEPRNVIFLSVGLDSFIPTHS